MTWVLVAGCGRFGFDARSDAAPDAPDAAVAAPDAGDAALACGDIPCAGTPSRSVCNGHCFATCDLESNRGDAEATCTQWGGTLATVHSDADEACVSAFVDGDVWIGLQQLPGALTPRENWVWIDGSAYDYDWWKDTVEPNDGDDIENGEEDCGMNYAHGGWNDTSCTRTLRPLCAR